MKPLAAIQKWRTNGTCRSATKILGFSFSFPKKLFDWRIVQRDAEGISWSRSQLLPNESGHSPRHLHTRVPITALYVAQWTLYTVPFIIYHTHYCTTLKKALDLQLQHCKLLWTLPIAHLFKLLSTRMHLLLIVKCTPPFYCCCTAADQKQRALHCDELYLARWTPIPINRRYNQGFFYSSPFISIHVDVHVEIVML